MALALFALVSISHAQGTLAAELTSQGVHTAMLIQSSGVDDAPVWSADSKFLSAHLGGAWYRLDLSKLRLKVLSWHGEPIAVIAGGQLPELVPEALSGNLSKPQPVSDAAERKASIKASFHRTGFSTALILTKGRKKVVLWQSDLENCGALVRSPDGKYIAYLCEQTGIFVTDVVKAFTWNSSPASGKSE